MYASSISSPVLPRKIDLREFPGLLPPVYNQGSLGSCTGQAIAAAIAYQRAYQKLDRSDRTPSRLMIYYLEREVEGTIASDSGAEIRTGIKAVNRYGVCFEDGADGWPYDPLKYRVRPSRSCFNRAHLNQTLHHRLVPQLAHQLRGCLAEFTPIVFGFTVYEALDSDEVARTAVLPMPNPAFDPLGGHAVMAVGYDDTTRHFTIRNSWGEDWGEGGYFYMPYEYLTRPDLSSDFWAINLVEDETPQLAH